MECRALRGSIAANRPIEADEQIQEDHYFPLPASLANQRSHPPVEEGERRLCRVPAEKRSHLPSRLAYVLLMMTMIWPVECFATFRRSIPRGALQETTLDLRTAQD